jgi:hypothetical protein
MNLNEILLKEIDTIQPADLEAVLRSLGWRPEGGIPNLASQWLKYDDPGEPSVLVPLNRNLADYTSRLWEALRELERVHGDQSELIITNLLLPGLDEVTNEKEESTIAGSIPWTIGEKQILGFREILTASAKAAEVKERYYGRKRWSIANRFLAQVRMGQTRIGSYVITALSPVGAIPLVDQKHTYEESLGITGRQVIETLVQSLETLKASTDEFTSSGNDEVFEEAVSSGVSLDLVRAVQKNLGTADWAATSIRWTSRITAPAPSTEIVFDRSHVAPLTSAMARLTEVVLSRRVAITGRVTGLKRYEPGRPGTVELNVLEGADDSVEFVLVNLGESYDDAIEFHRTGTLVRAEGELIREGRTWELTNVTSLALLTSNEITHLRVKFPDELQKSADVTPGMDAAPPMLELETGTAQDDTTGEDSGD